MANSSHAEHVGVWIARVGVSQALDPTLETFRELQHLGSELGGVEADFAERAFGDFLTAADYINPLYLRKDEIGTGMSSEVTTAQAKILRALLSAIDILEQLRPLTATEPRLSDDTRTFAQSLWADE